MRLSDKAQENIIVLAIVLLFIMLIVAVALGVISFIEWLAE